MRTCHPSDDVPLADRYKERDMKKYYELTDDTGTRFWMIEQDQARYTVRYGKLGNKGRTLVKDFDSEEAATQAFDKQIKAKEKQGYTEADIAALEAADTAKAQTAKANEPPQAPKVEAEVLRQFKPESYISHDELQDLCYTHDGAHLLGLGQNQMACWETGQGARHSSKHHGLSSYNARFLPGPERTALSGGYGSTGLRLLDESGATIESFEATFEEDGRLFAAHLSKDIFLAAGGQELHHIDRHSKEVKETFRLPLESENSYSMIGAFSPDGGLLACGISGEEGLYLIDTKTGETRRRMPLSMSENAFAFSPESKVLATFQSGEGLKLWDLKSGDCTHEWRRWEFRTSVRALKFSADGNFVLLILNNKMICWALAQEERPLWVYALTGHNQAAAFSPDGLSVAFAEGRRVSFLELSSGLKRVQAFAPHAPYEGLYAEPDAGHLVAMTPGTQDSHIFDLSDFTHKQSTRGTRLYHSPHHRELLVTFPSGMGLLDPLTMKHRPVLPNTSENVALGADMIAMTLKDNYEPKWLRLYSLSGQQLSTLEKSKKTCPDGPMCFSPSGQLLYAAKGKRLLVWDLETEERIHDIKEQPTSIEKMAISKDGKWLATSDRYRNVLLWNLDDMSITHRRKSPTQATSLSFTWDGRLLLLSASDAQVWDLETYQPVAGLTYPQQASASTLSSQSVLYIATQDCGLLALDASALLDPHPDTKAPRQPIFLDWESVPTDDLGKLEETLLEASWQHFDLLRDTAPLRRVLTQIEQAHGVQELHFDCTDRILQRSKRLIHPIGHKTPPIDEGISPCGRWLATGSWTGEVYEDGGELQIWERETGRCVNTMTQIDGGVGWPDYYGQIQWSPDGTELGVGFSTNAIGNYLPFASANYPMTYVSVTDGGNRPPGWEWTDDGRHFIVYYGATCVAPLRGSSVDGDEVNWYDVEDQLPNNVLQRYSHFFDNAPDYGPAFEGKPAHFTPAEVLVNMPSGMTLPSTSRSPLVVTGKNFGLSFSLNPAFPLRKERRWFWCIAFETGLVVAPPEVVDLLPEQLNFTIENRFSWPVHWADERHYSVVNTFADIVEHPLSPLRENEARSLAASQPKDETYFQTYKAEENEYYSDYKDSIQVASYQLNTKEANFYQSNVVFEGSDLNQENLSTLLGKTVIYAESYSPERIQIGTLLGVRKESCTIFYKSVSGRGYGMSGSDYNSLVYIGEAVPAEYGVPASGLGEEDTPETGERAQFPCGKNLSAYVKPDNEKGELNIPLPYEGEDKLVLHWQKVFDFEVDEFFANKWGKRLRETKDDCHYLGTFFLNGEELLPAEEKAEYYAECRFDAHGNDSMGSSEAFEGEHGLDVSLLMRYVPKKTRQFKKEAPVTEIESIRFGSKGSYSINWENQGGSLWELTVIDTKLYSDEDMQAQSTLVFRFDLFEKTLSYAHYYQPTDYWNMGD